MIKIGVKGLAKFMTASSAGQRKVLRDYKFPTKKARHRRRITAKHAISSPNTTGTFILRSGYETRLP